MAHSEQRTYCEWVKSQQPDFFIYSKVLDVGSLDINGNNRYLFDHCTYTGIDIGQGANVDIVKPVHLYEKQVNSLFAKLNRGGKLQYDVVISCEMLEHDQYWEQSLRAMYKLLRPGGLLIITAATEGRPPHGTNDYSPHCSPFTNAWYKNITKEMLLSVLNPREKFTKHHVTVQHDAFDIYFSGIKK